MSSAIPVSVRRPLIVKWSHSGYSLDPYADRLYSHGYDVINTTNLSSTAKAAHEFHPALLIVQDDPAGGVDALNWLAAQHSDTDATVAMTPLIVLADVGRVGLLRHEEQPDRVVVLMNRADTLNQLTRTVRRTLRAWGMEMPPAR